MSNAYEKLSNLRPFEIGQLAWDTEDIDILKLLATDFTISDLGQDQQLEILVEHNANYEPVGKVLDLLVPNIRAEYTLMGVLEHPYCTPPIAQLVWDNFIENIDLYREDNSTKWEEVLIDLSKSPHITGDIPFDIFKWVRDANKAPTDLYKKLQIQRNLYNYHKAQLPDFAVAVIKTTVPGI